MATTTQDPPVQAHFRRLLLSWQRARGQWAERCAQALVADLSGHIGRPAPADCDTQLERIDRVIARLRLAACTGVWSANQLQVPMFDAPRWTARRIAVLSRGESFEVLLMRGDWWRVLQQQALMGWVHRVSVSEQPPAMLSSEPGGGATGAPRRDDFALRGGRG